MGNYQKGGSGGRSGGGGFRDSRGGGRPSFGGKSFGGGRGGNSDVTMHKATCSECGKTCEVPFRPTGDKPVYCKDCFGAKRDSEGGAPRPDFSARGPRKSFGDKPSFRSNDRPAFQATPSNDGLKKELGAIGAKLDRLIEVVEKVLEGNAASKQKEEVKKAVGKAVASDKPKTKVAKKKK